jgi:hypothetical protein
MQQIFKKINGTQAIPTGWNFPSNNYGKIDGINDAGIETFTGRSVEGLGKEVIQNSLDARRDDAKGPVLVKFELESVDTSIFPAKEEFVEILSNCIKFWKTNDKAVKILKKALETVSGPKITVLKIGDYNTTGLTDSDKEVEGNFNSLIKSVGVSNKDQSAGGSFGIGKHAVFSCSKLRTVFYGTKDINGKKAFQGVSKLATHEGKNGQTQGTGYYGTIEKNRPIFNFEKMDEFFSRDEIGTDIFIFGFEESENWREQIIKSIIENFFVAIMEGKLCIDAGGIVVDHKSIGQVIEEYVKDDLDCLSTQYYNTLIKSEDNKTKFKFNENFNGMGELELHIMLGKNYPKKVAFIRSTGMKILDKGHFRTTTQFIGVLLVKGLEINKFLRSIETPSHDKFEIQRHDKPTYAKKTLNALNEWISNCVKSLSSYDNTEEIEIEGISQYLPDDFEKPASSTDDGQGVKNKIASIESKEVVIKPVEDTFAAVDKDSNIDQADINQDDGSGFENEGGSQGVNGEGGNDTDGRTGIGNDGEGGAGSGGTSGDTDKPTTTTNKTGAKPLKIRKSRVFCTNLDEGWYRVIMESADNGRAFVSLKLVGEESSEEAPVVEAKLKESGISLSISNKGLIGPIEFIRGCKSIIEVKLKDSIRCAMEVNINAS